MRRIINGKRTVSQYVSDDVAVEAPVGRIVYLIAVRSQALRAGVLRGREL